MTIICGDCLEEMKKFPDNHFSAIVTDPPYGLSFMGKGWDHEVPGVEYWKECLRISKPGSYLLAMGGSRTCHRTATAIEASGYEIRDTIMWIYGQGFPKSHNHFGIEGYGTALKPAYEPILLCMKPLDGTFKQNAEKWGQAGINIDGCRVETTNNLNGGAYCKIKDKANNIYGKLDYDCQEYMQPKGRWPANLILDSEAGALLDEQSGRSKSPQGTTNRAYGTYKMRDGMNYRPCHDTQEKRESMSGFGDSGGASRFFYCAKASSRERNEGLEGMPFSEGGIKNDSGRGFSESDPHKAILYKNNHPTVKPLALMEYLIKLVMPPFDGILLDPFAGSGTTILAAKRLGFEAIGIEKSEEYCEIARARCKTKEPCQRDLFA